MPHDQLREAALVAAGEVLQTAPVARLHVKRMLNERYGLIDYQTMNWGLAESPNPGKGSPLSWKNERPVGSPPTSPKTPAGDNRQPAWAAYGQVWCLPPRTQPH